MSKTLPFDWNGVFQSIAHVSDDGELVIQKRQPSLQLILDGNAAMRSVNTAIPRGDQRWGHHVARIPMLVWERWIKEIPGLAAGEDDAMAVAMARLNSREYCLLKTYDGRV